VSAISPLPHCQVSEGQRLRLKWRHHQNSATFSKLKRVTLLK